MNKLYPTYTPTCKCNNGVIKRKDGRIVCRWCRKPYQTAGYMLYSDCHFKAPYGTEIN